MSDIINEMENIEIDNTTSETKNEENGTEVAKEFDVESFDLFSEDDKPQVDDKNNDIINKRLNSRFAELEKREQAYAEKQAALEEKLKRFEENGDSSDYATIAKVKSVAEENPLKAAKMIGLSYEKLTEQILKENDPDAENINKVKALEDKIHNLENGIEEKEQKRLDNEEKKLYNEYTSRVKETLSNNKELTYINAMNAHQRVLTLIEQYVEKHGVGENNIKNESLEDIELKAAKAVERNLKREYEGLRAKLEPKSQNVSDTTLTNQDRTIAPYKKKEVDELNRDERHSLAVELLKQGFTDD